jgi:hypothetical protein
MDAASIAILAFAGGSVMAAGITAFVKHCIFHPVISVCLDRRKGCTGRVPLYKLDEKGQLTGQYSHDAQYLRLRIENTGLSSIRDCCGLITGLTKHTADKGQVVPPQEVFYLGWAHHSESKTRNIPRGAYFYMDIATLDLFSPTRRIRLSADFSTTLIKFFNDEKATYEFKILVAADNAKPQRDITITVDYDPKSDELGITPLDATRHPWWRELWRRSRRMKDG